MMQQQATETPQHWSNLVVGAEYDFEPPRRGQLVEATILEVSESEVLVDMGVKRDGLVPRADLDRLDDEYRERLEVGLTVPVSVLRVLGKDGELVVSLNRGLQQEDWVRAQKMVDTEEVVETTVLETNRGGVVVEFGRLRAFVPNSHLTVVPRGCSNERKDEIKDALVGTTLVVSAIEVVTRRRLVFSQKAAQLRTRRQLLQELSPGDIRTGVVGTLTDFGAFVDLGGCDGLIHISEIDWHYVNHPSDVLSVGDEVRVYVLSVDRDRERIGLSRKRLLPDPWHRVSSAIEPEQVIEGRVSGVVEFGVFVEIGEGVDGLVHVCEIPANGSDWRQLEPGSALRVRVVSVDSWRRRIKLSLRRVDSQRLSLSLEDLALTRDAEV